MTSTKFDYVVPGSTLEYYQFVAVTLAGVPAGLYGMDQKREELHRQMCAVYGLNVEATKKVTDNMDRFSEPGGGGSSALHRALQDMMPEEGRG